MSNYVGDKKRYQNNGTYEIPSRITSNREAYQVGAEQFYEYAPENNPIFTKDLGEEIRSFFPDVSAVGGMSPEELNSSGAKTVLGTTIGLYGNVLPSIIDKASEGPIYTKMSEYNVLPYETKSKFTSDIKTIKDIANEKEIFTPETVGATNIEQTKFVRPKTPEEIIKSPIFQARQAQIDEQTDRARKVGMESLAARGILDSGAALEFEQRLQEDANRQTALVFANMAEKDAARAEREAGRETEFYKSTAEKQSILNEAAAKREQRVNEIATNTMVELGMNEGDLIRAFDAETTGQAKEEFFRYNAYKEKVLNLPKKLQEEELAFQAYYIGIMNAVLSGQQPVTGLMEASLEREARERNIDKQIEFNSSQAQKERASRDRIARRQERSDLYGEGIGLIGDIFSAL